MATNTNPLSLDDEGLRLLRLLVELLTRIDVNDPRSFISYKGVHDALNLPQSGTTFGESLKVQGLSSLASWTADNKLPGITGLIIDTAQRAPGPGYFDLFKRKKEDYNWWLNEIKRSKEFDWSSYLPGAGKDKNPASDEWSDDELMHSVEAYLEMQRLDRVGEKYVKTKYYEALALKFGRTAKAFEFRMQNISYVLTLMGRDWLSGLKPARNVGINIAVRIEELIAKAEKRPSEAIVGFEMVVRAKRKARIAKPNGIVSPSKTSGSVAHFQRDPAVKAWVLQEAEGTCECCQQPAPFKDSDNDPFLEVHHVRKLCELGSDTTSNAVALCPNCHRALHYSNSSKDLLEKLYLQVTRLVRE